LNIGRFINKIAYIIKVIVMTEMITLRLPKNDVEAFLRVVEDIKFIKDAEKGDKEIEKSKFKTRQQLRKRHIGF